MDEEELSPIEQEIVREGREWEDTTPGLERILDKIIHPQLAGRGGSFSKLTRDMKISNISPDERWLIVELTDISEQWDKMKAEEGANHLLLVRDSFLVSSSSINGFERNCEVTQIKQMTLKDTTQKGLGAMFKKPETQ